MKKILLLLILIYSYSFSTTITKETYDHWKSTNSNKFYISHSQTVFNVTPNNGGVNYYRTDVYSSAGYPVAYCKAFSSSSFKWSETSSTPYRYTSSGVCYVPAPQNDNSCTSYIDSNGLPYICNSNNELEPVFSPDPTQRYSCKELFQLDGVAYTCNPNTNEALPIDNSNGLIEDENGDFIPNCNDGYDYAITQNGMSNTTGTNGMYNSYSCEQITNNETGNNGDNSNTFPDAPTTSTGADGSTTWTWSDGTTQTLSPNGTLTTYYPDGTNSVKQVGNDYTPTGGGSSSGGGSGGGGFTGPGTNGNTTNETDTPNNNDTPIDNTPAANSCNDSNLTLQEKLLCEMNAGVKKLNSETSPENSLNNLIKEMNNDNNTNTTAINTNIKETNKLLTDTKSLNENQLSELKNVTNELKKLNATTGTSTSTITQPITDNFTPAENDTGGLGSSFESDKNLIDSFTGVYTDFKNNLLGHKDTLDNLITNTATTINGGIGLSLSTTEIINCPLNYNLDMTHTIGKNIAFNIDICEVTSKTKPYLYPIFLIIFTVGSVFFAFRFIGVLL